MERYADFDAFKADGFSEVSPGVWRKLPGLPTLMAKVFAPEPARHVVVLDHFKTISESNTHGHWAPRYRRAKAQRGTVYRWLRHCLPDGRRLARPLTVTITRIAPRQLDAHDNLAAALKATVDGISDYLAGRYLAGQDRQPGLTFQYAQRQGKPKTYSVEILFEER